MRTAAQPTVIIGVRPWAGPADYGKSWASSRIHIWIAFIIISIETTIPIVIAICLQTDHDCETLVPPLSMMIMIFVLSMLADTSWQLHSGEQYGAIFNCLRFVCTYSEPAFLPFANAKWMRCKILRVHCLCEYIIWTQLCTMHVARLLRHIHRCRRHTTEQFDACRLPLLLLLLLVFVVFYEFIRKNDARGMCCVCVWNFKRQKDKLEKF